METFGLLKILTSLLQNKQSAQLDAAKKETSTETAEEKIPLPEQPEEQENAFLKLLERHEKRSKEIDKKR